MTEVQKKKILIMRQQGLTFSQIAEATGIPRNTLKSFVRRETIKQSENGKSSVCLHCGKWLAQIPKQKPRLYCDDKCRSAYWNRNRSALVSKDNAPVVCACCGRAFDAQGRKTRKYCGRECYASARWGLLRE